MKTPREPRSNDEPVPSTRRVLTSLRLAGLVASVAFGLVACAGAEDPEVDEPGVPSTADSEVDTLRDTTPPQPKPPPPSPGCRVTCRVCPNPSQCAFPAAPCSVKTISCALASFCCPDSRAF